MASVGWKKKLILLLSFITGCGTPMFSNAWFGKGDKYDWLATESAPHNYPMKIISGSLRYYKDANGRGLYVPAGTIFKPGWGNGRSTHITGDDFKPLPDQLSITYFSYAENTFYTGVFPLPYDKILKIFKDGTRDEENPKWAHWITVGVAPGGAVSVWVSGMGWQVEVFHGQAEKTDMDFLKVMDITTDTRDGFVTKVMTNMVSAEEREAMQKNGIPYGLWGKYRAQYNWVPVFLNSQPEYSIITYFNGEAEKPTVPFDKEFLSRTRPVPDFFWFKVMVNRDGGMNPYNFRIRFDDVEMMEAFARLGANQEPMRLEFDTNHPEELTQVHLRNAKQSITLKKWKFD